MAHFPSQWDKKKSASAPEPVIEEQPEEQPQPNLTVAQLKEYLDVANVEYPSDARKADLEALVEEFNGGS